MSAVATQATVPDAPSSRRRALLPGLVLAVVALAAVAWMADFTRGVTFWSDDWGFIVDRRGWDGQALFGSHNGHLEPGGLGRLEAPRDGDPATPWRVRVQPASAAQRCGG